MPDAPLTLETLARAIQANAQPMRWEVALGVAHAVKVAVLTADLTPEQVEAWVISQEAGISLGADALHRAQASVRVVFEVMK